MRFGYNGRLLAALLVLTASALSPAAASAEPEVGGDLGDGTIVGRAIWNDGNGHEYVAVRFESGSWQDAQVDLSALLPGYHLATSTSEAENTFIAGLLQSVAGGTMFIGAFQEPISEPNPNAGWTWVTGEPWEYTAWADGEPNDGGRPADEQWTEMYSGGEWNDVNETTTFGYIAESPAPVEPPGPIACGATITEGTTLTADLACSGTAMHIGAPGLTIDLGGFTVSGDNTPDARGINNLGYDFVTIMNGTISGFDAAVWFSGDGVTDSEITTLTLIGNREGIFLNAGSHRNHLHRNVVLDSAVNGIVMRGANGNLIELNEMTNNSFGGVNLLSSSDENMIRTNTLTSNGAGMLIQSGSDANQVIGNVITDGTRDVGLTVQNSDGTTIADNDVSRNPGRGISIFESNDTIVTNNVAVRNGLDGIRVFSTSSRSTVALNRSESNSDDGIHIDNAATVVRDNAADSNADLGIEAVAGVDDRGGNTAHGNGNPLECVNVVCLQPQPACTIIGTSGNDVLVGTAGPDVICGLAGDDIIYGKAGDDVLRGGGGNDRIYGGYGADSIKGHGGNDRLVGGAQGDMILGGAGDDVLLGKGGGDRLEGNRGNDRLLGARGNDDLFGGRGTDSCDGGSGSNTFASCE